jgi:hypothetical protein
MDRHTVGAPPESYLHDKPAASAIQPVSLTYKFERLRERLREAVLNGEWSGRLPGERMLARRFGVNAKTLSKALTDLAAEGLLERRIGRGTYVKGPVSEASGAGGRGDRWLVLCDGAALKGALVQELLRVKPDCKPMEATAELRPSFLSQFSAVVDCASDTPDAFYRDMMVRGVAVVSVSEQERAISTHAVRMDRALAAFCLGRDLLLAGHRRLGAVDAQGSTALCDTLRQAAARYAPEATVDACFADEVMSLVENGVSGIVCDGTEVARRVRAILARHHVEIPEQVSLAAMGAEDCELPCSGYFLHAADKAGAVADLLRDLPGRPTVLWLRGKFADHGTMSPPAGVAPQQAAPLPLSIGNALAS